MVLTRSPVSMTSAWESGWSRIPAAMLVTQEIARTFICMWRAAITSATVDKPTRAALVQRDAKLGGFFARDLAIFPRISARHVGKADAEAVVVHTDQRIRSLQIDV